jgi:hypothetical protein
VTRRRVLAFGLLVTGFLALSMIHLRPLPPPARAFTIDLAWAAGTDSVWESPRVEAVATVAGLGWRDAPPDAAWVRSSEDGSEWSPWVAVPLDSEHGPDPGTIEASRERSVSGPVYVGEARFLQFRVEVPDPDGIHAELVETAGRNLSLLERAGHLWKRVEWGDSPPAGAVSEQPPIVPREAWGGDQCLAASKHPEIEYNRRVSALFIHHTVTSNSRAASDPLAEIYAICRYHVVAKEWWDIAYNFLIGPDGTIYEGRHGGVDQPVRGAHTRGLNSYSMGIAYLGTYTDVAPSSAARQALVDLIAWKFDLDHVDPLGTVTVENLTDNIKFAEGEIVTLRTVSGHRDAAATSCPGSACYTLVPDLRTRIEAQGGNKIYWQPSADPVEGLESEGYEPVSFRMRFTVPMAWNLEIRRGGESVHQASGFGASAVVTWDGTLDGVGLPYGEYEVLVDAVPEAGETPSPVREFVRLGSYRPPFSDDDDSVHEAAINSVAELGITKGCNPPDNDRYCPDDPVTRGEMAAFLHRALGDTLTSGPATAFTDDDGSIFETDIEWLAATGITKGCNPPDNNHYCPDDPVTRGQMAAFLGRAFGLDAAPAGDPFRDDDGSIFEADIGRLAAAGITKGCNPPDNDRYCPDRPVTRGEMATFLIRILDE